MHAGVLVGILAVPLKVNGMSCFEEFADFFFLLPKLSSCPMVIFDKLGKLIFRLATEF
jgi:hypothetical protein